MEQDTIQPKVYDSKIVKKGEYAEDLSDIEINDEELETAAKSENAKQSQRKIIRSTEIIEDATIKLMHLTKSIYTSAKKIAINS